MTTPAMQRARKSAQHLQNALASRGIEVDETIAAEVMGSLAPNPTGQTNLQALTALTRANEALLGAEDEAALSRAVCDIIVHEAHYPVAWISQGGPERFEIIAGAGQESLLQWLEEKQESSDDGPMALPRQAISRGRSVVFNRRESEADTPHCQLLARYDVAACTALPLYYNRSPIGALVIFAERSDAFDTEALELLERLAANVSFGITVQRNRKQRVAAEDALDESEFRYATTFEFAPLGIAHIDTDGTIERANTKLLEILGYGADQLIGKSLIELSYPEDREQTRTVLERARRDPDFNRYTVEKRYRRNDGAPVWTRVTVSAVRHHDGSPAYFIGAFEDITERMQSMEQERFLRQQLETLYQASPDMIFLHAADGRIVEVNDNTLRRYGFNREQMRKLPFETFSGSRMDMGQAGEYMQRARDGEPVDFEWVAQTQSGEEFPVEVRLRRLDWDPAPEKPSIVAVVRDISERKRSEEDLRRSYRELADAHAQLQQVHTQLLQSEKMASIGQLAAGVAHEINNPVGYVNANISSLEGYLRDLFALIDAFETEQPHLPEAAQQRLDAAKARADLEYLKQDVVDLLNESKEGVTRVRQIVQDLKDFSRIGEVNWEWNDLHKGLDSTLNIVWNELKYKAEVIKEYGDLPPVECVLSQLNQVFMNLLVNAGHAIESRGTITIRTGREGDDGVWVRISDTGKGIAPENLAKLFDPFFTTKPVGKGTGLGLSLAYSIVQKHGGHIEVESELGKGSIFTVHLPIQQPETETGETPDA